MKCEYCGKEIGEKEFYVMEHWTDINGDQHSRALHSANGQNFMDNCYSRFNHGFWLNTVVDIEFPKCNRPVPDYDMLIRVKHKRHIILLKCKQCGSDLETCVECNKEFLENDAVYCFYGSDNFPFKNHMHTKCSTHPILSVAVV